MNEAWNYIEKIEHSEDDMICEECGEARNIMHTLENEASKQRMLICYDCAKHNEKYNWEWED